MTTQASPRTRRLGPSRAEVLEHLRLAAKEAVS